MYIRIRYELESFQALKLNTDVDRVLGSVLDHAESDPIMQKGVKNPGKFLILFMNGTLAFIHAEFRNSLTF